MVLAHDVGVEANLIGQLHRFDHLGEEIVDVVATVRPMSTQLQSYLHRYNPFAYRNRVSAERTFWKKVGTPGPFEQLKLFRLQFEIFELTAMMPKIRFFDVVL